VPERLGYVLITYKHTACVVIYLEFVFHSVKYRIGIGCIAQLDERQGEDGKRRKEEGVFSINRLGGEISIND